MNRKPIFDAVREIRGGAPFTSDEVRKLDAAIDEAEGIAATGGGIVDPSAFFGKLRFVFGSLDQAQVEGFNTLCAAFVGWPLSWSAYGLATAWRETNRTMQPVREAYWLSETWRRNNLRYWPWYGRGYCQLTWRKNYEKADAELELDGALIADPDLALKHDIAARIMVKGMAHGWFTQKKLPDFLPAHGRASLDAYKEARRIINGTDAAAEIAGNALKFEAALMAGGWQ